MAHRREENFERLFGIHPANRLVAVRSWTRGGDASGTYCEFKEFDPDGQLRARYQSFDELGEQGQRRSGWKQFDALGRVVKFMEQDINGGEARKT